MQPEIVALITLYLIVVAGLIVVIRYITQLQFKLKLERLKSEAKSSQEQLTDFESKYTELMKEVAVSRRIGNVVLAKKMDIDDALESIARSVSARAGSVYIPMLEEATSIPSNLVFLSIYPFGQEAKALKRITIPMQSIAGQCFQTGQPFTSAQLKTSQKHYNKADLLTGFQTTDTLNIPLYYKTEVIGVLQLLNKQDEIPFNDDDLHRVEPFTESLATQVYEFSSLPGSFEILGITPDREIEYATVMFCDLTRSSILFREMNGAAAVRHLNEYLEQISDIAFKYGATVDKYTGDGAFFRFNVPRSLPYHTQRAVEAALEMKETFDRLKSDWIIIGELAKDMYIRIGLASGPVRQATIGHPQYQYLTILGQPVNVASYLCSAATRNRSVIAIDQSIYDSLGGQITATQLSTHRMGKATEFSQAAYELQSLIEDKVDLNQHLTINHRQQTATRMPAIGEPLPQL